MPDFSTVERFCLFVGYPRSGHSLIGSLLDAHPDFVIAHEFDVLAQLDSFADRDALFRALYQASVAFTAAGRDWMGYNYNVPGQWNGRVRRLRVIGDKKGGQSTEILASHPATLDHLRSLVGRDPHFVHVIRNPFDNITTMHRRSGLDLDTNIEAYFRRARAIASLQPRIDPAHWCDVPHEAFVRDPQQSLARLIAFFGQSADAQFLADAAAIVFPTPKQTRTEIDWPTAAKDRVQSEIDGISFLRGYTFESV